MSLPLVRYQLDPTGINPDNAVIGEVKSLGLTQVRTVAPTYAPFFTESLHIFDHTNNRELVRGVDYQCVEMLQTATAKFGKEIAQLILIINVNVGSQVRLNYQVLGGLYQNNVEGLNNMYNTFLLDNRPVDWSNVLNKPFEYPPSLHRHLLEDIYGFEPVIVALERIRNAIILSDVPAFEALIDWVKRRSASCMIFDPVTPTAKANDNKLFNITTSNRPNGSKFFWTLKYKNPDNIDDTYFLNPTGSFEVFQNRSQFTLRIANKKPNFTESFNIEIRAENPGGPLQTVIEDIKFIGRGNRNRKMSMAQRMLACCILNPKVPRDATSLMLLGE